MSQFADLRRVPDETGSHIEPEFDPAWDDLTALRWHAACVRVDGGVSVEVHKSGHFDYSISYRGGAMGSFHYAALWTFLNGVGLGARLAREATLSDGGAL